MEENLENRKDLLCEIYYEFKQANMLSENLNMIFHDFIPELNFDCEVIEQLIFDNHYKFFEVLLTK